MPRTSTRSVTKPKHPVSKSNGGSRESIACPSCGAEAVSRSLPSGNTGKACHICGWWRMEQPDGLAISQSPWFTRRSHSDN